MPVGILSWFKFVELLVVAGEQLLSQQTIVLSDVTHNELQQTEGVRLISFSAAIRAPVLSKDQTWRLQAK
eukprot:6482546-Amphidinium_carterae.1